MKLTPLEILKHLGINVPEEGLSINPHDALLHTKLLGLLGKCMAVEAIPADELTSLHNGLLGVMGHSPDTGHPPTPEQLDRLRVSLRLTQAQSFGMKVE